MKESQLGGKEVGRKEGKEKEKNSQSKRETPIAIEETNKATKVCIHHATSP